MESQDKRMCNTESVFGATVDCNAHRVYDEDWASRLGPIPSEVFREAILPSGSQTGGANTTNNFGSYADLPFDYPVLNNKTCQQKYNLGHDEEIYKNYQNVKISQLQQQTTFVEERKLYPSQASFEAPSPNSVLESRTSSSSNKSVSFGTEVPIPVKTRSKRVRPTANPWLLSPFLVLPNKGKKRKSPSQIPVTMEAKKSVDTVGVKKCAHCEITKTPQWREGPMGPKTLCNACGVRYRSGRLYPEYRPAASPTFVPALHSNSHRKVIEMRQKAVE
ncbi:putative transcription factor C2C2-GATA family [Helianthus annuus]|nr:putative transcription factor C2C2-GATA family [Helianthus annuus]